MAKWYKTFHNRHGFGICYTKGQTEYCFYEDEAYSPVNSAVNLEDILYELSRYADDDSNYYYRMDAKTRKAYDAFLSDVTCKFSMGKDNALVLNMTSSQETVTVKVEAASRFDRNLTTNCACKSGSCYHRAAANTLVTRRIDALQHLYMTSSRPVDKSLFVTNELRDETHDVKYKDFDEQFIQNIKKVVSLADEAHSPDYYRCYYRSFLSRSPYDYDAHYLEDRFYYLILALLDDTDFREAVFGDEDEANDDDYYEARQHKSNRLAFKRIYKNYQRLTKALDRKGDYSEDPDKEFILKYRSDWAGLLQYYTEKKTILQDYDLPFIDHIATLPSPDPKQVEALSLKVDEMCRLVKAKEATPIMQRLLQKVSDTQRVDIYCQMRNISMSTEEIHTLSREDQMRMIRNTPLNLENFNYIMNDLLKDSDATERGQYVLFAASRLLFFGVKKELKDAILEQAKALPYNRLLYYSVCTSLGVRERILNPSKTPEKELSTYFVLQYDIVRNEKSMHVEYQVLDPVHYDTMLTVIETDGRLEKPRGLYYEVSYDPKIIKTLAIQGKEEEFRAAMEENQDALDTSLFTQRHRNFAKQYQELCASLSDEKILYNEEAKVGIDWQLYSSETTYALSFKVGNTKKYIVKDATEFIDHFRSNATVEYGKDLILTHDTANLTDEDAALVKLLMTAKFRRGRAGEPSNKRYITIGEVLLASLLEGLAGRTILYNDVPCLVRLENRKLRIRISDCHVLSASLDTKNQTFLNLEGKGFLVTKDPRSEDYVIDRLDQPADEIDLLSLVVNNPKVSIKPILKDFRKNIYSRFFDMFDVDKFVERDFTLSQLRLNTYFDYEHGKVLAKTKVLRDDKEIKPELLVDRIDRVKLELLDNYLQSIGFEDGVISDESRVLAFFKMDFTRLKTLTNVYLADSLQNKQLKSIGNPVIRVSYENNMVKVFLEKSDFTQQELEQIIAGLRKKRKYILLSGDRIVDLDSEAARDFGETVNDFEMDPKNLYKQKTVSMINAIKAFSHERSCRVDKYLRDMIDEIRSFKEADIQPPEIQGTLRDYQLEGFKWLSILTKYNMGGILADDMGLGKTIQMISLMKSDDTAKPSLVVCPKSLVFNWESEFARFDGQTRVTAIYGPEAQRTELINAIKPRTKAVYITSYDSLRNDISKYNVNFNFVILDEAQYIKNVNALKTKSVKELNAVHRFAMTGTPIENSVVDLWSIFDFIMPGYFDELSLFKETKNDAIARKAGPFILRRVKEDVLEDLPPKYERILSADMSTGQRKVYDAMRLEAKTRLEDGGKAFDLLPYLTRLRQVCVDPSMFVEDYTGGSGKMDMLSTLIPEYLANHHRILIFSQFVKALEAVDAMLKKKGIPTYFLSGATAAKDRVEMMDSFNNGSGTDVFLISLKAGGTGLNLTGADTVIHLDPWWNVAAENQASDRTHRIGQTRNVEVIKLIASDSIEQRVVELQDLKKEVIKQVISDDDGSVTSASLEDIAFVLD